MSMQCVQKSKRKLVADILAQRTYSPESGVWRHLEERLMRLSKDDLATLAMLIAIKVGDCGGENHVDLVEEMTGQKP